MMCLFEEHVSRNYSACGQCRISIQWLGNGNGVVLYIELVLVPQKNSQPHVQQNCALCNTTDLNHLRISTIHYILCAARVANLNQCTHYFIFVVCRRRLVCNSVMVSKLQQLDATCFMDQLTELIESLGTMVYRIEILVW